MVEVLKTDVEKHEHANQLIDLIHKTFTDCIANFDLEDCDKILRVQCAGGIVHTSLLIHLLENNGFHAEILP